MSHFSAIALFYRNVPEAIANFPVDGGARQAHVKRHLVIVCRERFQVGADLVADIAAAGSTIAANQAQVDHAMLHQVSAEVVDDQAVRYAVMPQLPGGQASALIAWPGFVDPHVNWNTGIVGHVYRRGRGTPVDGCKPAGVTVGQNIYCFPGWLRGRDLADYLEAMLADGLIGCDIFCRD